MRNITWFKPVTVLFVGSFWNDCEHYVVSALRNNNSVKDVPGLICKTFIIFGTCVTLYTRLTIFSTKMQLDGNEYMVYFFPAWMVSAVSALRPTLSSVASCKVSVIHVRSEWYLKLLDIFSKNTRMSNFMRIRPVGAELFHGDIRKEGRTDGQTWRR